MPTVIRSRCRRYGSSRRERAASRPLRLSGHLAAQHFPHGGFSVPGWLRRDEQRVAARPVPAHRPASLRLRHHGSGGTGPEIVANIEREVREKPRYWNRLWKELQPDVGAVTFYALDVLGHRFWHTFPGGGAPVPPGADPRIAGVLPRTARGVDRAVGEIVAAPSVPRITSSSSPTTDFRRARDRIGGGRSTFPAAAGESGDRSAAGEADGHLGLRQRIHPYRALVLPSRGKPPLTG